jgi:hypothetical protein
MTPRGRSLARDRGGAIMVLGVFMAALMVAFIYYVKGLGDAILFRERMQDAADSAAFAAATVHARGMNLVALINITTVAVLAVVAAARLIHDYLAPTTALLAALNAPPQKPGIEAVGAAGKDHYEELARPLLAILRAGNTAANAVSTAIPAAAEARAVGAATGAYQPTVEEAFLLPSFPRLPVEDSTIEELTRRAGPAAVPLAAIPFGPFSVAVGFIAAQPPAALAARGTAQARATIDDSGVDPGSLLGMVPQTLSETAVLGAERFQVRAVVGGQYDFALAERGVAVASWGESEASDANQDALAELSGIAIAQAEYFYAGPGGRDEWLWNQGWQARFRRLRLEAGQPCANGSVTCDTLAELLQRGFQGAVVH